MRDLLASVDYLFCEYAADSGDFVGSSTPFPGSHLRADQDRERRTSVAVGEKRAIY
jgi:hypothetical protein